MCKISPPSVTSATLKVALCREMPFEHYKLMRDAIAVAAGTRTLVLDFQSVERFQSWIVGYILHLEDSLNLHIEVRASSMAVDALMRLAKLERFLVGYPAASASGRLPIAGRRQVTHSASDGSLEERE